jgi:phosphoglycolate phosphatase
MRDLVMFDFDGVIADSLAITTDATIEAMQRHGYGHLASRDVVVRIAELNWFEGLLHAGIPLEVSDTVDEIVSGVVAAGGMAPFEDIPRVMDAIARRHLVVIVTSNRTDIVERFLAQWRIAGVGEVLGGDKGMSKVDKIRGAVRDHPTGSAWFIGDTVGDIEEGRSAGVGTIAAAWGWHTVESLTRAEPDHIAVTPEDLLALLL